MQQGGQHLGGFLPVSAIVAPAGNDARQVVVVPEQAVPAFAVQAHLPLGQHLFQRRKLQRSQVPLRLAGDLVQADVLKLEHHREFLAPRVAEDGGVLHIGAPGLTHGHQIGAAKGVGVQLPDIGMQHRAVGGNSQVRVLGNLVDDIQPETAHALVHPKADGLVQLLPQGGVVPVQVRLFDGKLVEIILPHLGHPGPGRAAKGGPHLVGRRALHAVAPDVIVVVGVVAALFCLLEPAVLVRGVVQHQIHDDADVVFFGFGDEVVHVGQRAEHGVNIAVVGNVVAVVILRAAVDGAEPDGVDAQALQIAKPLDDAGQVANAVAVAVLKAAGIDLVDHSVFPPGLRVCHSFSPYWYLR